MLTVLEIYREPAYSYCGEPGVSGGTEDYLGRGLLDLCLPSHSHDIHMQVNEASVRWIIYQEFRENMAELERRLYAKWAKGELGCLDP